MPRHDFIDSDAGRPSELHRPGGSGSTAWHDSPAGSRPSPIRGQAAPRRPAPSLSGPSQAAVTRLATEIASDLLPADSEAAAALSSAAKVGCRFPPAGGSGLGGGDGGEGPGIPARRADSEAGAGPPSPGPRILANLNDASPSAWTRTPWPLRIGDGGVLRGRRPGSAVPPAPAVPARLPELHLPSTPNRPSLWADLLGSGGAGPGPAARALRHCGAGGPGQPSSRFSPSPPASRPHSVVQRFVSAPPPPSQLRSSPPLIPRRTALPSLSPPRVDPPSQESRRSARGLRPPPKPTTPLRPLTVASEPGPRRSLRHPSAARQLRTPRGPGPRRWRPAACTCSPAVPASRRTSAGPRTTGLFVRCSALQRAAPYQPGCAA